MTNITNAVVEPVEDIKTAIRDMHTALDRIRGASLTILEAMPQSEEHTTVKTMAMATAADYIDVRQVEHSLNRLEEYVSNFEYTLKA